MPAMMEDQVDSLAVVLYDVQGEIHVSNWKVFMTESQRGIRCWIHIHCHYKPRGSKIISHHLCVYIGQASANPLDPSVCLVPNWNMGPTMHDVLTIKGSLVLPVSHTAILLCV